MSDKDESPSFKGLLIQYQNVCNWFGELGFNYRNSRYGRYLETFEELALNSLGQISIPKEKQAKFDNAYVEICRITAVHEFFKERDEKEFITQLKKVISGRDIRGESKKDDSRNIFFELWVAHFFIKSGYEVKLAEDPDNEPDLLVSLSAKNKLAVECKCLNSEKQIKSRIKEGNTQIVKRKKYYNKKNICITGVIALDFTNLIPKRMDFYGGVGEETARMQHMNLLRRFVGDKGRIFSANQHSITHGLMCESGILIKDILHEKIGYRYQTCHCFYHYGSGSNLFLKLAKQFDV